MYSDSRLDLLTASGVKTSAIINVKQYNRGVRAYKLTFEDSGIRLLYGYPNTKTQASIKLICKMT